MGKSTARIERIVIRSMCARYVVNAGATMVPSGRATSLLLVLVSLDLAVDEEFADGDKDRGEFCEREGIKRYVGMTKIASRRRG
jgi:hypothetical protein